MTETTHAGRLRTATRRRLSTTAAALAALRRHRGALAVGTTTGISYLLAFLWFTTLLSVGPGRGVSISFVEDPLALLTQRTGAFTFEPIGIAHLEVVTLLLAPIDLALATALAVLVGINLGLGTLAVVQPASCGVGAGSGLAAAVPALLSGSACCAPVIVIVLGLQVGATFMTVLPLLLPLGVLTLLGSVVYVAGKIDPAA